MYKFKREMLLEDDSTEYGGVSYIGETIGDFIDEVGINIASEDEILLALKECGCKVSN